MNRALLQTMMAAPCTEVSHLEAKMECDAGTTLECSTTNAGYETVVVEDSAMLGSIFRRENGEKAFPGPRE